MENENVLNLLKTFIEENNLKVGKVEEDLGVSKNNLSGIMKGKKPLSKNLSQKIVDYMLDAKANFVVADTENKLISSLGDLSDKVTTANKVPVPEKPKTGTYTKEEETALLQKWTSTEHINRMSNLPPIGEDTELADKVRQFCKQFKTSPDDLFSWLMDNYGRKVEKPNLGSKSTKAVKSERLPMSNWRQDYIKAKTGQK